MTTPTELAQQHADLSVDELGHLQRLLGSWGVLSDLSFSDLLLVLPVDEIQPGEPEGPAGGAVSEDGGHGSDGEDSPEPTPRFIVIGQMRPNNRPTLVEEDLVGQSVGGGDWAIASSALDRQEVVRGHMRDLTEGESVLIECIPVRLDGRTGAVLTRISDSRARPNSQYERTYLQLFDRLASMVVESAFPFPDDDVAPEEAPRVGDGIVVVDAEGRVEFASPNAMNAFHRMGVFSPPEGRRFTELGVEETAVEWALATGRPVVEEVERRPDVIVLVHCMPLLSHGMVTGAMILLRDVTDVRRLDRLLLSKDAAIREVHHRVKNNLQTISSLLSLQARRLAAGAGREALWEAERRVRSIAIVHEILSREPGDQVPFDEIVEALVRMAEDSVVSSRKVEIRVEGELGEVAANIATPMAVIVAELLQNAVGHAFGGVGTVRRDGSRVAGTGEGGGAHAPPGHVVISLSSDAVNLSVEVRDDGCGLPEGFDIEETTSLGLSIVRDLVVGQLQGVIDLVAAPEDEGGGTRAHLVVPVPSRV